MLSLTFPTPDPLRETPPLRPEKMHLTSETSWNGGRPQVTYRNSSHSGSFWGWIACLSSTSGERHEAMGVPRMQKEKSLNVQTWQTLSTYYTSVTTESFSESRGEEVTHTSGNTITCASRQRNIKKERLELEQLRKKLHQEGISGSAAGKELVTSRMK